MKKNMGITDKIIRFLAAAVIAVLYFTHVISGALAIILGVMAIVFLVTSFVSFCPLYPIIGVNTRKGAKQKHREPES